MTEEVAVGVPGLRLIPGEEEDLGSELRHSRCADVVQARAQVKEHDIGGLQPLSGLLDERVHPVCQALHRAALIQGRQVRSTHLRRSSFQHITTSSFPRRAWSRIC
jgi:hypothetical protein